MKERLLPYISQSISVVFFIVIALAVIASLYKFVFARDYIVKLHMPCNSEETTCFVRECEPDYEDCEALGDTIEFSLLRVYASELEICDARVEECDDYICEEGNPKCEILSCSNTEDAEYECSR